MNANNFPDESRAYQRTHSLPEQTTRDLHEFSLSSNTYGVGRIARYATREQTLYSPIEQSVVDIYIYSDSWFVDNNNFIHY